ncbi:MAG: electron transfer flavoprotein subunit alpha/FixB family protein, partial [Desulfosarcina sp.]|nr:electron transfer flavoprotein subunit alpha/FixB family protein [Desulfobacterales bacterium]
RDIRKRAAAVGATFGFPVTAIRVAEVPFRREEVFPKLLSAAFKAMEVDIVCVPHTSSGMDYAAGLAVRLCAGCIMGVEQIKLAEGGLVFSRSVYGGKWIAEMVPETFPVVLTIMPGAFVAENDVRAHFQAPEIDWLTLDLPDLRTSTLRIQAAEARASAIADADTIVAAGRGIGNREKLDLLKQLGACFHKAAIAGSRIVCDLGWLDYRQQVGVTGTTVAPALYLACGISGAVQHVNGMRGAGFVAAINTDPCAAIFNTADVGVVEDLETFLPLLIEAIAGTESA